MLFLLWIQYDSKNNVTISINVTQHGNTQDIVLLFWVSYFKWYADCLYVECCIDHCNLCCVSPYFIVMHSA